MSPGSFYLGLAVAVLLPLVMRLYRAGTGPYAFLHVDEEFRRYRRGKFVAAKATVLFRDIRIDRFAPSAFRESRGPAVAIYICRDDRSGQHWLWRLYRPTEPEPTVRMLAPEEAQELLQRKDRLLRELCPRQRRKPAPPPPPEPARKRHHWDG